MALSAIMKRSGLMLDGVVKTFFSIFFHTVAVDSLLTCHNRSYGDERRKTSILHEGREGYGTTDCAYSTAHQKRSHCHYPETIAYFSMSLFGFLWNAVVVESVIYLPKKNTRTWVPNFHLIFCSGKSNTTNLILWT